MTITYEGNVMVLNANEGAWLTNGTVFTKLAYCPKGTKATAWWDATDAQKFKAEFKAEQERLAEEQGEDYKEPTLEDYKAKKLAELETEEQAHHAFNLGTYTTWLTEVERASLFERLHTAEYMEYESVTFYHEGYPFTFSLADFKSGMYTVADYAHKVENVANAFRLAIGRATAIEAVYAIDVTQGWPDKVTFN